MKNNGTEQSANCEILQKRLRRLRLDRDTTCAKVGTGAGLSTSAITAYENGTQQPTMDSLVKLADYFDVSIDYLCGRTDLRKLPTKGELLTLENDIFSIGGYIFNLRERLDTRENGGEK